MGVGHSTRIARKAISNFNIPTKIKSIDPAPRADIIEYSDEISIECVTKSDLSTFSELKSGDILFIDGSHICHAGTDVPFFFLNVFSLLKPGVIVHIHDIFLPWEYREPMLMRGFNEQHMLAAMLGNTESWETLFPVFFASQVGIINVGGGSYWMKKRS